MRSFFDPSPPALKPADIVLTFTNASAQSLLLPKRALIVFTPADLKLLVRETVAGIIPEWRPFKRLYRPEGKVTVLTRSLFGGPSIAALAEELAAFGVREFCVWGYCGGIGAAAPVGDIILVTAALREDGISYHYLDGEEEFVPSDWAAEWEQRAETAGFLTGTVWSSDALYRETVDKVARYNARGILGVEMEVASLYSVCRQKGLKAVAFLVVSDMVRSEGWQSGFNSSALKRGTRRLAGFIEEHVIV